MKFFLSNFLDKQKIEVLRNHLAKYSNEEISSINRFDKLVSKHELIKEIINSKFIEVLYKNLGIKNFMFLDRIMFQKNIHNFNKTIGWHKDAGKREQAKIISKKNNLYIKVGIYLQDNDKNYGGGIDILKTIPFDNLSEKNTFLNILRKIYYFLYRKLLNTKILNKAGDVIGFNGLVFHGTSVSKKRILMKDRYSIYFLITNESTIKDILETSSQMYDNDFQNKINKRKINDIEISIINSDLSDEIQRIVSD